MKVIIALCAMAAMATAGVIPGTTLVRAPSHDTAIIKSSRIGGNFAYSTVEGHAYAAISPIIQHVPTPVAVSYDSRPIISNVAHITPPVIAPVGPVIAPVGPALAPALTHGPVVEIA